MDREPDSLEGAPLNSKQALAALTVAFVAIMATAAYLMWYVGVHEYSNPLDMMR